MKFRKLIDYGMDNHFLSQLNGYEDLKVGRIISQYNELYKLVTEHGEMLAEVSGKFRYSVQKNSEYPAVGDFVIVDYNEENISVNAIIHKVLSRKSVFKRRGILNKEEIQIISTNIDIVFICTSLNKNYNLNRIERYVAIALDSNIRPIIILTKSDLCENLGDILTEISNNIIGVDVIVTSKYDKKSYEKIFDYLKYGVTASFVGSSGVGKSTIINGLIGKEYLSTNDISNFDKGKHTTTRREVILLKRGGVVIDTPGMREIGLDLVDVDKSFQDIDDLSINCKFNDCTHTNEPGCFVIEQIKLGNLDKRRLESYEKLKKESLYDGLTSREIENKKSEMMFKEIGGMKNVKKYMKSKKKY